MDQDKWLNCMDGEWYPLPSGKMICHVGDFKLKAAAKTACEEAGGYLAELQSRDDMQTLNYVMWSGRKAATKSSNRFRVGAVAENMQWRWEESGDMVDIGPGRIIKPQDEDDDLSAYDGQHLYLKLVGFNSAVSYLNGLPYFDLYLDIGADAEEEFLCMKDGKRETIFSRFELNHFPFRTRLSSKWLPIQCSSQ